MPEHLIVESSLLQNWNWVCLMFLRASAKQIDVSSQTWGLTGRCQTVSPLSCKGCPHAAIAVGSRLPPVPWSAAMRLPRGIGFTSGAYPRLAQGLSSSLRLEQAKNEEKTRNPQMTEVSKHTVLHACCSNSPEF